MSLIEIEIMREFCCVCSSLLLPLLIFNFYFLIQTTALAVAAIAFGDMIIHCRRRNASVESADFAEWLTIGLKDSDFHGLIGLLSSKIELKG